MALYKTFRIDSIEQETADCASIYLSQPGQEVLSYQAGQFITFVFEKPTGTDRRSYSISSAPLLYEPLRITVKRIENGEYSRKLLDYAKAGDLLTSTGAAGFFVLPDDIHAFKTIFFIAAGVGITPVYALIKTVLHKHPHIRVVLIYSNRTAETTVFYAELKALAERFPSRLVTEFLFSSAVNLARARLGKWLLGELLKEYNQFPVAETLFYTCGPFDYMRMVTIALLENHVPLQHIKKENFTPLKIETGTLPPDTHPHIVSVQINHSTHLLQTQYPQTILAAAKKAGLALPYSCEAGRCGSCVATCIQGKVWMSYNEVLMDDEIAKGRVLTCVGYPVEGDVVLRFE